MIKKLTIAALLISLMPLAGCGPSDPHEKVAREGIDCLEEMGDILASVDPKDDDSAASAITKIKTLGQRMADIAKRKVELGDIDKDKAKALSDKYGKRAADLTSNIWKEAKRLAFKLDVNAAVLSAMSKAVSF